MNRIKKEIIYFFSRKLFFSQLIVFQLIICFSVFMFSVCFSDYSTFKTRKYNETFSDKHFYELSDHFVGDETDFLRKDDALQKLKLFYSKLVSDNRFTYNEIYRQPVYIKDFSGPNEFYYGYTEGGKIRIKDDMSLVNALWCGYDIINNFEIETDKGRWFLKDEFSNTYEDTIPVVLGNSYKEYFEINDVISAETMTDNIFGNEKMQVTGFLKKDSVVSAGQKFINLNKYIIMPSLNILSIPDNTDERNSLISLYLRKSNGEISSEHNAEYIQMIVSEICKDLKIEPYYRVVGAENQQVQYIHTDIDACNQLLKILSVVMIIFACGMLTAFQIINVKQNIKYFSVLLVSGMNYHDVFLIILCQGLIFQAESLFFAVCGTIITCNIIDIKFRIRAALIIFTVSFIITLISAVISYIKFTGYDIAENLRKR